MPPPSSKSPAPGHSTTGGRVDVGVEDVDVTCDVVVVPPEAVGAQAATRIASSAHPVLVMPGG
jgi:hypothetical protein